MQETGEKVWELQQTLFLCGEKLLRGTQISEQSSHESLLHVNIQNSAFAISSRLGDKCHYFQRSR